MPLFRCEGCGCVENTALSNYWHRWRDDDFKPLTTPKPALCSACDPAIAQWHGEFPRRQWTEADEAIAGMPKVRP